MSFLKDRAMALKEYLLLTILITISIDIPPSLAWNPNVHRYESYDLERGPVFYEAYYPDNSEEPRSNYEEKRFFDQGAVLERSYQVPSDHLYPENTLQADDYRNADEFPRANGYIERRSVENVVQTERANALPLEQNYNTRNNFVGFQRRNSRPGDKLDDRLSKLTQQDIQALDIKEISNIAKRAISRDLENWNVIENYLNRVRYQNRYPMYQQRAGVTDQSKYNTVGPLFRGTELLREAFNGERNSEADRFYAQIRDDSSRFPSRIELPQKQRSSDVNGKLNVRDPVDMNNFEAPDSLGFQNRIRSGNTAESGAELSSELSGSTVELPNLPNPQRASIIASYPPENIFEPRPQVINYIFSKKSNRTPDKTVQSDPSPEEGLPHNYGDNLIQDEIKKTEEESKKEEKGIGVTSIKISEEPRHKTRHHHGEWPKRDYSHRHQP